MNHTRPFVNTPIVTPTQVKSRAHITQPRTTTCMHVPSNRRVGGPSHAPNFPALNASTGAFNTSPDDSFQQPPNQQQQEQGIAGLLAAFWKFVRPHTIRGTVLGATALTIRAVMEVGAPFEMALVPRALRGLAALLCGNGYIVGINQIYDVDIDKVNKPYLPIAAGQLSPPLAWILCILLAGLGVVLTLFNFGQFITYLYSFGLILGTIYSIPPLRLKRFAIPAFMIIATVRGFLLNFGVYYATKAALGVSFSWSPPVLFITSFVTLFATAIAINKDLPDVAGDKLNKISTFATRVGVEKVSLLGTCILLTNYIIAVILALRFP